VVISDNIKILIIFALKTVRSLAEPLKNIYNSSFIQKYASVLSTCLNCEATDIEKMAQTGDWDKASLKERMNLLAVETDNLLKGAWTQKFTTLRNIVEELRSRGVRDQNLEYIFLADIVAKGAGETDLDTAFEEMEYMTQFVSFEFAGRYLLRDQQDQMMSQMLKWATHSHENVRRYASEGCRPKLPWGIRLNSLVDDPSPILPVLELLKNDDSLYVRKSVANNLNDISWSHPDLVMDLCAEWKGYSSHTDWIVKRALRTLLKNGNKRALNIVGLNTNARIDILDFQLEKEMVRMNDYLHFNIQLKNLENEATEVRLEYAVYFLRKNGRHNKKIFKISDLTLSPQDSARWSKKHAFGHLTTRQHYTGQHYISLVVNGQESPKLPFALVH
jgi:3-methyladenine DNA glycosylase AlkC